MPIKFFVNLPVRDLDRSVTFFTRLGLRFDARFTDHTATAMMVSDDVVVMLLTHEKFRSFTPNAVCDASRSTEVLLGLPAQSRQRVDELVNLAVAAGGRTYGEPRDHGFMYQHGFQDPDGHIWELIHMDAAALPPA